MILLVNVQFQKELGVGQNAYDILQLYLCYFKNSFYYNNYPNYIRQSKYIRFHKMPSEEKKSFKMLTFHFILDLETISTIQQKMSEKRRLVRLLSG